MIKLRRILFLLFIIQQLVRAEGDDTGSAATTTAASDKTPATTDTSSSASDDKSSTSGEDKTPTKIDTTPAAPIIDCSDHISASTTASASVSFPYGTSATYSVAATPASLYFVNTKSADCGPISSCSILAKDCSSPLDSSQVTMSSATPWAVVAER